MEHRKHRRKGILPMNCYVLSCLSERSLCLAESVQDRTHSEIHFAGVDTHAVTGSDLTGRAETDGFLLHREDIHTLLDTLRLNKTPKIILMISDDEHKNLTDAVRAAEHFDGCGDVQIYTYTSAPESEALIDNLNIRNYRHHLHPPKIRRVLPERDAIYRDLAAHSPFENAKTLYKERWIDLVIIGLGDFGRMYLSTMLWFCQMERYYLRINIFDRSPDAEERFYARCPGIAERGSNPRMGEDYYDLHFHPGLDPDHASFFHKLTELPEASLVFIDLGSDSADISAALSLRSFYSGQQLDRGIFVSHDRDTVPVPRIQTVVRNDEQAQLVDYDTLSNFRGQYYRIETIGKNRDMYDMERLLHDPLEEEARRLHCQVGEEKTFEMYEYFRRSSMATALHLPYRRKLTSSEAEAAVTEHRRWCAYMRSVEGYRYGTSRDDLAKRHPSLTSYANLSTPEQEKDSRLNPASEPEDHQEI
jgi:hypothetical protein